MNSPQTIEVEIITMSDEDTIFDPVCTEEEISNIITSSTYARGQEDYSSSSSDDFQDRDEAPVVDGVKLFRPRALRGLSWASFPSLQRSEKLRTSICLQPFTSQTEWFEDSNWNRQKFELFAGDQMNLFLWLVRRRLIANQCFCTNCANAPAMIISADSNYTDIYLWRCSKCGRRCSPRARSVFEKIRCPMDVLLYVAFLWFDGASVETICSEIGESAELIDNFSNRLRSICTWQLKQETERLEGVVEISEAPFFEHPQIYVMAGVERFGNRCFLVRLPPKRCNQRLFLNFIRRRIEPGSTIITSDWPGYKPLSQLDGYVHHTVNDRQLDDVSNKADTLLCELNWFVSNSTVDCQKDFSSVLDEFVWRRSYPNKRFNSVLWILPHVYNVS